MSNFRINCCVLGMVSTNCYIVYNNSGEIKKDGLKPGVIIDPGDNASYLLNKCRELKVKPEAVLLTHGHFDHILAAEDIRRSFHIPIMASEKEMTLLEEADMNLSMSFGEAVSFAADRWLRDGEILDLIGYQWKVLHTPGHTAGCLCYYVEEEGVLFSGDTLFRESVGRTDLPTANPSDMIDSVAGKLLVLPEETKVYPGHGEGTMIGYEKKYNVIRRYRR